MGYRDHSRNKKKTKVSVIIHKEKQLCTTKQGEGKKKEDMFTDVSSHKKSEH